MDAVLAARAGNVAWRDVLAVVARSPLFRLAGSRNPVYVPLPAVPAAARVVLKVSPDAVAEAELAELVASAGVRVPTVLHAEPGLLATEFICGVSLHACFERGDFSHVHEAVRQLALLHGLPRLWAPTNLRERLCGRLCSPFLGIAEQVDGLMEAMEPLLWLLSASEHAVYTDRVPENMLVHNGLVQIDFEAVEWAPAALDLANLLAYMDYSTHLWREGVNAYFDARMTAKGVRRDFWPQFLAAVVYRSLCFVVGWSKPGREHLLLDRLNALNRALLATDLLGPTFGDLKPLQTALHRLKATMPEASLVAAA